MRVKALAAKGPHVPCFWDWARSQCNICGRKSPAGLIPGRCGPHLASPDWYANPMRPLYQLHQCLVTVEACRVTRHRVLGTICNVDSSRTRPKWAAKHPSYHSTAQVLTVIDQI
jgi:hypothetical protein